MLNWTVVYTVILLEFVLRQMVTLLTGWKSYVNLKYIVKVNHIIKSLMLDLLMRISREGYEKKSMRIC